MVLWRTLRRIALAVFVLSTMLLLGVRLYESSYIYSTSVMTVTHVITPLLLPLMGASLIAFLLLWIITGIASEVIRAKQRKNNI